MINIIECLLVDLECQLNVTQQLAESRITHTQRMTAYKRREYARCLLFPPVHNVYRFKMFRDNFDKSLGSYTIVDVGAEIIVGL